MAASYPGALPTKITAGTYLDSNPHDVLHDSMYDEIVAIATEIGTLAKGSYADVSTRIAATSLNTNYWADVGTASQFRQTNVITESGFNAAWYRRYGNLILWRFYCSAHTTNVGSPAAGALVTVDLPSGLPCDTNSLVGWGIYRDAATPYRTYPGTVIAASTTTACLLVDDTGSGTGFGSSPSMTVATSDTFHGFAMYETTA